MKNIIIDLSDLPNDVLNCSFVMTIPSSFKYSEDKSKVENSGYLKSDNEEKIFERQVEKKIPTERTTQSLINNSK